jgi:hypothetical protein
MHPACPGPRGPLLVWQTQPHSHSSDQSHRVPQLSCAPQLPTRAISIKVPVWTLFLVDSGVPAVQHSSSRLFCAQGADARPLWESCALIMSLFVWFSFQLSWLTHPTPHLSTITRYFHTKTRYGNFIFQVIVFKFFNTPSKLPSAATLLGSSGKAATK